MLHRRCSRTVDLPWFSFLLFVVTTPSLVYWFLFLECRQAEEGGVGGLIDTNAQRFCSPHRVRNSRPFWAFFNPDLEGRRTFVSRVDGRQLRCGSRCCVFVSRLLGCRCWQGEMLDKQPCARLTPTAPLFGGFSRIHFFVSNKVKLTHVQ